MNCIEADTVLQEHQELIEDIVDITTGQRELNETVANIIEYLYKNNEEILLRLQALEKRISDNA